jgi:hypothetical protein
MQENLPKVDLTNDESQALPQAFQMNQALEVRFQGPGSGRLQKFPGVKLLGGPRIREVGRCWKMKIRILRVLRANDQKQGF